jgi:hypothetical protein
VRRIGTDLEGSSFVSELQGRVGVPRDKHLLLTLSEEAFRIDLHPVRGLDDEGAKVQARTEADGRTDHQRNAVRRRGIDQRTEPVISFAARSNS